MSARRRTILLLSSLLLVAPALRAAETGSISGVVKDSQGGVLPGATVKVSGPVLPTGREAVTTGTGSYIFQRLMPGIYKVEANLAGMGTAAREVQVLVDVDTQVELALSPTVSESLTVEAQAPEVDLRNAEVNFNYTATTIKDLPLQRTYSGLFQLIPGVGENMSTIGPSAGGSRQDNTYLMDGVNITNVSFGYLSTEVNELDIVDFNVKRGAISAEFGRAAGIVTNAVSKSGTNQLAGSVRFLFQPTSFMAKPENAAFGVPQSDLVNPAANFSGPLVKDKVFGYGSIQYFKTTQPDRVNQFGTPLPDRIESGEEYYGKITATPTPKHLINASYRYRPKKVEGSVSATSAPTVATTDETTSQIATFTWTFFPNPRTTFDLKFLYSGEDNSGIPVTSLGYLPTPFDINNLAAMGQYTDPTRANLDVGGYQYTNTQNYTRTEVKAVFGRFLDIGKTSHQVKAGLSYQFGQEDLNRLTNGWGQISRITVSGALVYRARYYFEQPSQIGQGESWGLFAQDTMTIGSRLTLNLGVLFNSDSYAQDLPGSGGCPVPANTLTGQPGGTAVFETSGDKCTFIKFGFPDEVQPRLGFNYNVRKGKGDKLYANWGLYYNMDQQSSSRSLSPRRIYQREARFNATTGALISDLPRASTTGKLIDPDLKPTYNNEFLGGYATPFAKNWSVDLFYIYRDTKNFIEDVPSVLPATGPYAAANLPCTLFPACQGVEAQRTYKAFTVEINRRMAGKWSTNISYTWSSLKGNFDLDYTANTAVFNTSSFIQDGPGTNVQEVGRYGPLRQDRPSIFKLFGTYMPIKALTVGGYLRVQSGTPWNARGQDTQGGSALYYLEPAGTNRNPTWTNFDLLASYLFHLGKRSSLTIEARCLNLFGNQTQTSTDSVEFTNTVVTTTPPFIAPGTILNPFYATGNGFAPPRRLVMGLLLNF